MKPSPFKSISDRFDLLAFMKSRFGEDQRTISGDEFQVNHAECEDERRRFWVNTRKRMATCYRCERSFLDSVGIVQHVDNIGLKEALFLIRDSVPNANSLGAIKRAIEALDGEQEVPEHQPLAATDLPTGYRSCADQEEWPPYIVERIGSRRLATKHGIGWCVVGHYARRMIIPIRLDGKLTSFAARAMWKKPSPERLLELEAEGKRWRPYLYPPGCSTGRLLFNYDVAKSHKQIILTEGCLDAIRVGDNAVAVLGKKLSSHQLELLLASDAEEIVVMLDGDAAGEDGTRKTVEALLPFYRVRIVRLPDGCDPDAFTRPELREMIRAAPLEGGREGFRARISAALSRF